MSYKMKQEHEEYFLNMLIEERARLTKENEGLRRLSEEQTEAFKLLCERHDELVQKTTETSPRVEESEDGMKKYRDAVRMRDEQIVKLKEELEYLRNNDLAKLKEENARYKKEQQGNAGKINSYELQLRYARAKGFKFALAGEMKAFLDEIEKTGGKPPKKENREIPSDGSLYCPSNIHDKSGNKIVVGSADCEKCAFNGGKGTKKDTIICKQV